MICKSSFPLQKIPMELREKAEIVGEKEGSEMGVKPVTGQA